MLDRLASLTWRRPRLVLALVGMFVVAAGLFAHDVEHHLKAAGFTDTASESERAAAKLRDALGYDANPGIVLVIRKKDGKKLDLESPAQRREINRLAEQLRKTKYVGHVINPLSGAPGTAQLIESDRRSLVLSGYLATKDVEEDGGRAAEDAERRTESKLFSVKASGFAPAFQEVNDQTREDLQNAELIAFPLLAILLLVVFRGFVAASVPLVIGVVSIVTTMLLLRLMSAVTDTSAYALNITTTLSLGLAVDYALLLVSRYREELARYGPSEEAHRRMVQTAGRTVLFSGFTVAAAMIPLAFFPQRFLYSLGVAGAAVALVSALVAVVLVSTIVAILGSRIDALAVRKGPAVSDESGGWYRLAHGVMRRPVPVATLSALLLLVLAAPLASLTLTGPSVKAVPPGQPSYEPSEYLAEHYPRSVIEAITITVAGKVTDERMRRFAADVEDIPAIKRPVRFIDAGDNLVYANIAPPGPSLDRASQDVVDQIRALNPPRGGDVLVSGNTARFMDQKQSLADHAPPVMLAICLITLVLLFLLTGSVLLPLKTLLMNGLTLAATLGVLVIGFEWGLLDAPFGYGDGPDAIEVTSVVFMIAVLFGLATDYAVLVMARIKELHDGGLPNEEAVAVGIGRTGRVISAAAVMIAVVFLASGVSPVFFMKQIAVGLAVGVIIDATIVRALLVPSLMRLFGEWNWWAPGPLRRLHDRFGISEAGPPPPVPVVPVDLVKRPRAADDAESGPTPVADDAAEAGPTPVADDAAEAGPTPVADDAAEAGPTPVADHAAATTPAPAPSSNGNGSRTTTAPVRAAPDDVIRGEIVKGVEQAVTELELGFNVAVKVTVEVEPTSQPRQRSTTTAAPGLSS